MPDVPADPTDTAAVVAQLREQARALNELADAIEAGSVTANLAADLKTRTVTGLPPVTHHIDRAIVGALAASRWPLRLADLAERAGFSRRSLGPRLKFLESQGVACRPFGARGGWALCERSASH